MPPWDCYNNPDYTVINLQAGIIRGPWEFMLNLDNATDEQLLYRSREFSKFWFWKSRYRDTSNLCILVDSWSS